MRASAVERFAAVALVAMAFLACGGRRPPALDKVRMSVTGYLSDGPVLLADARGHFRARGIELERVHLGDTSEAVPLLIRGRIDAAAMAMSVNLVSAVSRGAPIRIVANKGFDDPSSCPEVSVVVRPGWKVPPRGPGLRAALTGRASRCPARSERAL